MDGEKKCVCCQEWFAKHPKGKKAICILCALVAVIILVKIFAPSHDWQNQNGQQNTITISGKGELTVKPDIAEISFSVTNENLDVSKASDAVNTKIATVIAKLEADGVADADIKTTGYDISPQYNYVNQSVPVSYNGTVSMPIYPNSGTQVLAGYDVTQSIDVKIRDLTKAGQIVTDLGALNVTNVSGLSFTEDKYDNLVKQARDAAIADARSQATDLASALGVHLDKIVSYSDDSAPRPVYAAMAMSAGASAAQPAVLPTGENTITANVTVTYEIK